MNYIFEENFEVRDYECDIQGIVNNANYQHYMEHARHQFIKTVGLDFVDLHNRGIDTVVSKIEIAYKRSLKGGDAFVCKLNIKKEGIKYVFLQDIYRMPDMSLCTRGKVEAVAVINGRLSVSEELDKAFGCSEQSE
ncbi:MAG TPA: acyl-CoA thioesterase [Paludibacteraceae bacterium]|nr:acyl-CoA thioesterase [Paludibacteraceae bacterium]HOU67205.1 acyl-CoA thioesterase [Paludibacteraceae bacterium]HPH64049.1 acyl-CoA thioesterase [Paludibacteraceae bacterium]HQF49446.1 acyl-CoA thioesterase [Paludibacteraceae bacterium]HQJ89072.1 acyl-CoA thioesterase [Paludibacteraceae bacterium]